MGWRLLTTPPLDGPTNMAIDHALMERARVSGETVLRIYGWSQPVLSLGRNQRALGVYRAEELERRSISVVRRPTGGRGLLHHREVTYSVTAPDRGSLSESYQRINRLLAAGLARLGVSAHIAQPRTRTPSPDGLPCFAEPAAGEIVVGQRKLVGSAQWRDRHALLQHGSIMLGDDQSTIPQLMAAPASAPPPATLGEILGRVPDAGVVRDALFDAVRSSEDACASILPASEVDTREVDRWRALYMDAAWTWRR